MPIAWCLEARPGEDQPCYDADGEYSWKVHTECGGGGGGGGDGLCYHFGQTMTFDECGTYCEGLQGCLYTMPCIEDEAQNAFIVARLDSTAWIGYTSNHTNTSSAGSTGIWAWFEGCNSTYANWGEGEPNNFGCSDDGMSCGKGQSAESRAVLCKTYYDAEWCDWGSGEHGGIQCVCQSNCTTADDDEYIATLDDNDDDELMARRDAAANGQCYFGRRGGTGHQSQLCAGWTSPPAADDRYAYDDDGMNTDRDVELAGRSACSGVRWCSVLDDGCRAYHGIGRHVWEAPWDDGGDGGPYRWFNGYGTGGRAQCEADSRARLDAVDDDEYGVRSTFEKWRIAWIMLVVCGLLLPSCATAGLSFAALNPGRHSPARGALATHDHQSLPMSEKEGGGSDAGVEVAGEAHGPVVGMTCEVEMGTSAR